MITVLSWSLPVYAVNHNVGQVVFFTVGSYEDWQSKDALDDFHYNYQQIIPWLDKIGITHSMESKLPIIITANDQRKKVQRKNLDIDLGLILVDGDGSMKILYGVLTDVDWQIEIKTFLNIP